MCSRGPSFSFRFLVLIPPLWLFSKTLQCVWLFHSAALISNSVKHDLLLPFIRECLGPARVRIELQYEVLNYAEWGQLGTLGRLCESYCETSKERQDEWRSPPDSSYTDITGSSHTHLEIISSSRAWNALGMWSVSHRRL